MTNWHDFPIYLKKNAVEMWTKELIVQYKLTKETAEALAELLYEVRKETHDGGYSDGWRDALEDY